jgi:hypothetical protein
LASIKMHEPAHHVVTKPPKPQRDEQAKPHPSSQEPSSTLPASKGGKQAKPPGI